MLKIQQNLKSFPKVLVTYFSGTIEITLYVQLLVQTIVTSKIQTPGIPSSIYLVAGKLNAAQNLAHVLSDRDFREVNIALFKGTFLFKELFKLRQ